MNINALSTTHELVYLSFISFFASFMKLISPKYKIIIRNSIFYLFKHWTTIILAFCWAIWPECNMHIFQNKRISAKVLVSKVIEEAKLWLNLRKDACCCCYSSSSSSSYFCCGSYSCFCLLGLGYV
jgi:hypothetical protein